LTVTCEQCRFWERYEGDAGLCRRNAPFPEAATHDACWPLTLSEDWCGDFQPQPVTQKVESPHALPGQTP
jgi:hypothetical protein